MDPRLITAPVIGRTVPHRFVPAIGVSIVYNQVSVTWANFFVLYYFI